MQCVLQNFITCTLIFEPPATLQSAFLVVRLYIIRCFSSDLSWGLPAKKWICCFFLIRQKTASNSVEYNRHRLAETLECNCNIMIGQDHRHNVTMDNSFSMRKETGFQILINIVQNSQALLSVIIRARRLYKAKLNFVLTMYKSLGAITTAYSLITC